LCGVDTHKLKAALKSITSTERVRLLIDRGWSEKAALNSRWRKTLWDADHVMPVVLGGGCCGLEGLRTLCIPCHQQVTAKLASVRAAERLKDGNEKEDSK
jgi:hypothetical protein